MVRRPAGAALAGADADFGTGQELADAGVELLGKLAGPALSLPTLNHANDPMGFLGGSVGYRVLKRLAPGGGRSKLDGSAYPSRSKLEVLLGPASALYGPNSANSVLHVITKSPFTAQGTSLTLDGGGRSIIRAEMCCSPPGRSVTTSAIPTLCARAFVVSRRTQKPAQTYSSPRA